MNRSQKINSQIKVPKGTLLGSLLFIIMIFVILTRKLRYLFSKMTRRLLLYNNICLKSHLETNIVLQNFQCCQMHPMGCQMHPHPGAQRVHTRLAPPGGIHPHPFLPRGGDRCTRVKRYAPAPNLPPRVPQVQLPTLNIFVIYFCIYILYVVRVYYHNFHQRYFVFCILDSIKSYIEINLVVNVTQPERNLVIRYFYVKLRKIHKFRYGHF